VPVRPSLSVVVVAWNNLAELRRTVPALLAEFGPEDELIVIDNDSSDETVAWLGEAAPAARLVRMGRNVGFTRGVNAGAAEARGDLVILLNPDAAPLPGWGAAIRRPWQEGRGWAAWQALIAEAGGETINSAGNPLHFSGIVWAGMHGKPLAAAPPAGEVTLLSGACLAIPRSTFDQIGGLADKYFLYHEDVDISLRLRLLGGTLGIEPAAVVAHDYDFGSSAGNKWRWLERNRLATLVRLYPAPLLFLLAPALLAIELALLPASAAGGWGKQKLEANWEALRWLPRLLRERRRLQRTRAIGSAEFASLLSAELDSPFITGPARSLPVRLALRAYLSAVRALLR
jgi:N-acetylglucosaminyl-diphospho-decaprenol L-rhamnosyltransferase